MLASGRSDAHLRGARIDAAGAGRADLVYVDGVGTGHAAIVDVAARTDGRDPDEGAGRKAKPEECRL